MAIEIKATGKIGSDIKIQYFDSGSSVTKFSVYSSNGKNQKTDEWNPTTWVNCEAWGELGEFVANSFQKGDPIEVHGFMSTQEWENKDGETVKRDSVRVNAVGYGIRKKADDDGGDRQSQKSTRQQPSKKTWDDEPNLDDVPF
jgi:single-strand DNA-binding protein